MSEDVEDAEELPSVVSGLADEYPAVWEQYSELGKACSESGPLDGDTKRLVKLALAVGAQSEGAVHSHVRRGLEEGVDPAALQHVAVLGIPTIGFPKSMAAMTWIEDLTE